MTTYEKINHIEEILDTVDFCINNKMTYKKFKKLTLNETINDNIEAEWRLYCVIRDIYNTLYKEEENEDE